MCPRTEDGVERICTDVALLDGGRIEIEGKLSDIRSKYSSNEYLVEPKNICDLPILAEAFSGMRPSGSRALIFREKGSSVFDLLGFAAERRIPIEKIEHVEPTLESLFMEVTRK